MKHAPRAQRTDSEYLDFNPFDEGKGDYSIECRKVLIVTIRKPQTCMASYLLFDDSQKGHVIEAGSRAYKESAKVRIRNAAALRGLRSAGGALRSMTTTNSPAAQPCCGPDVWRDYEVSADNKTLRCTDCGKTYTQESVQAAAQPQGGELLPCPAGHPIAQVCDSDREMFYVVCLHAECFWALGEGYDRDAMPDHAFRSEEAAIDAWNIRANLPRATADIDDHAEAVTRQILNVLNAAHPSINWPFWTIRNLIAADPAPRATGETGLTVEAWLPIESAPRDGSPLRLFARSLIDPDFNPSGSVEGYWQDDDGWVGAVWNPYHDVWDRKVIKPSHYQKLPQPPAVGKWELAQVRAAAQTKAERGEG